MAQGSPPLLFQRQGESYEAHIGNAFACGSSGGRRHGAGFVAGEVRLQGLPDRELPVLPGLQIGGTQPLARTASAVRADVFKDGAPAFVGEEVTSEKVKA